jgi:hypothetical protein
MSPRDTVDFNRFGSLSIGKIRIGLLNVSCLREAYSAWRLKFDFFFKTCGWVVVGLVGPLELNLRPFKQFYSSCISGRYFHLGLSTFALVTLAVTQLQVDIKKINCRY